MRFLHLADLHLGKIVNGFNLIDDQRFALQGVLRTAKEQHVDAIVLAGDLYDKSMPSAEAVSLFDAFMTAVADMHIPCLAVPGNHDSAERVAYAGALLQRQGIYLSPLYDGTISHYSFQDDCGTVTFWLLPFIKPIDVRRAFPERADEIGQDYTAAVRVALEAGDLPADSRNVLIAHQFVTYAQAEPELGGSELSIGGLDNVDGRIFDRFDYVALGHIHQPQKVGRDTMRYAGSLLKYSYSEAKRDKTAVLVDMGPKGTVDISLVSITPKHDLREIRGTLEVLTAPSTLERAYAQGCSADDYIHAILTDDAPGINDLQRLRTAYPNLMGYDYESLRTGMSSHTESARTAQEMKRLSPAQLFDRFFAQMNGTPPSESQKAILHDALEATKAVENEGGR